MRKLLLASACAVLASGGPALANWTGTLSGDYTYSNLSGTSINSVGTNGSAAVNLGSSDFSLQGNGDYHYLWASGGGSINAGSIGGSLVWNQGWGRLAGDVGGHFVSSTTITNYGAGAEWFASPDWTLAIRGGGFSGAGSGYYVGGKATYYWDSKLAFSGSIDTLGFSSANVTDFSLNAEYLVWDCTSVSLGYTYSDVAGTPANSVGVALKFYFDGPSVSTLADHHRLGTPDYISTVTSTAFKF